MSNSTVLFDDGLADWVFICIPQLSFFLKEQKSHDGVSYKWNCTRAVGCNPKMSRRTARKKQKNNEKMHPVSVVVNIEGCHFNNLGRWVTYVMIFFFYLLNTPLLWLLVILSRLYNCPDIIMMKKSLIKRIRHLKIIKL